MLASENNSWDGWEPTSKKKLVRAVPSIQSSTPSRGIGRRQVVPPSRSPDRSSNPLQRPHPKGGVAPNGAAKQSPKRQIDRSPRYAARNGASTRTRSSTGAPESRRRIESSLGGEAPPEIDSTVFFPVGSTVKHRLHGRGVVQSPPTTDAEFAEKMLVRVEFSEDSMVWDLPMDAVAHTYE